MQTQLPESLLETAEGLRAESILRSCVHCGFCNATCPTYQLLGDELDGPRGRIYLIKDLLEEGDDSKAAVAQTHLDRCLTCRACETTCPSGVQFGELLEIGRSTLSTRTRRSWRDALVRWWLVHVLPHPRRFARWAALGRLFSWLLPRRLADLLPRREPARPVPTGEPQERKVLLLQGCVQQVATPGVNQAVATLCHANGIATVTANGEGCCGSLHLHLGHEAEARSAMRQNLDALRDVIGDVEYVVSTASGCGVTVKDYGRHLADDPAYAELARLVSDKTLDVSQLAAEFAARRRDDVRRVAWHAPCTLQHGQQVTGVVEAILEGAGYELVDVVDGHLCCGSAGTYSVLEHELSERLRSNKIANLIANHPDVIATANVGCQSHLQAASNVPVVHWVELLAGADA